MDKSEKIYDIVDKPSTEVSKVWKGCHILIYMIAAISGFASAYIFGILREEFGDNCVLYPTLNFTNDNTTDVTYTKVAPKQNLVFLPTSKIDETSTMWGDEQLCYFCQFVPAMSMILGSVLTTFFIMYPRGGSRFSQSGIERPWHIVMPSLIITGIFSIIILTAALQLQNGLKAFCAEFEPIFHTTRCLPEIQQFALKKSAETNPFLHFNLSVILVFVCVVAWFTAFFLLLLRFCCVVDFKIIEVSFTNMKPANGETSNTHYETEVLLEPPEDKFSTPLNSV